MRERHTVPTSIYHEGSFRGLALREATVRRWPSIASVDLEPLSLGAFHTSAIEPQVVEGEVRKCGGSGEP